jgi:hypothetical protein
LSAVDGLAEVFSKISALYFRFFSFPLAEDHPRFSFLLYISFFLRFYRTQMDKAEPQPPNDNKIAVYAKTLKP